MSNVNSAALVALVFLCGWIAGDSGYKAEPKQTRNAVLVTQTPEGAKIYSTAINNRIEHLLITPNNYVTVLQ